MGLLHKEKDVENGRPTGLPGWRNGNQPDEKGDGIQGPLEKEKDLQCKDTTTEFLFSLAQSLECHLLHMAP